jgi:hypothetical protein
MIILTVISHLAILVSKGDISPKLTASDVAIG